MTFRIGCRSGLLAWCSEHWTVRGQSKVGVGKYLLWYFWIDPPGQDNWGWQLTREVLRSRKDNFVVTAR